MALISKKTFRKWAKPLTERQLTFENAEKFAEVGNTATVKGRTRQTVSDIFTINQDDGMIEWEVGAVWLNGALVNLADSKLPGDTVSVSFDRLDTRPQTLYVVIAFTHIAEQDEYSTSGGGSVIFYTPTRAAASGTISFVTGFNEDETPTFLNDPATIDTATNAGTTGYARVPLASLAWVPADPPTVPYGFWEAELLGFKDPSKLMIFNLTDYSYQGQTWPTMSILELN